MNKTQTICTGCHGLVQGPKQSTQSFQKALAVHAQSCPAPPGGKRPSKKSAMKEALDETALAVAS